MIKQKSTSNLLNILLVVAILFLLTKMSDILTPLIAIIGNIIVPIIIGGFFYYALRPLTRFLKAKTKKSGLSAVLTILLVFLVIVLILFYGGNIIVDQFKEVFVENQDKFVDYGNYVNDKFREYFPDLDIVSKAINTVKNSFRSIGTNALSIFSSVGDFGTQAVLVPFVIFYLLKDDNLFERKLFELVVPKKHRSSIKNMLKKSDEILMTYINGQLLAAIFVGVLIFVGYLIVGMPNALLMATFALITAIIPIIGAFIGVLPAILIAATIDFALVIKVILVVVVVQQIESNLFTPNVMGNKLKLHPLAVIIIMITSIKLFGILGALVGIPLFLVAIEVGKTIYEIVKAKESQRL